MVLEFKTKEMVKKLIRSALFGISVVLFLSCSPQRKLGKLLYKHPELKEALVKTETHTVELRDTVYYPEYITGGEVDLNALEEMWAYEDSILKLHFELAQEAFAGVSKEVIKWRVKVKADTTLVVLYDTIIDSDTVQVIELVECTKEELFKARKKERIKWLLLIVGGLGAWIGIKFRSNIAGIFGGLKKSV